MGEWHRVDCGLSKIGKHGQWPLHPSGYAAILQHVPTIDRSRHQVQPFNAGAPAGDRPLQGQTILGWCGQEVDGLGCNAPTWTSLWTAGSIRLLAGCGRFFRHHCRLGWALLHLAWTVSPCTRPRWSGKDETQILKYHWHTLNMGKVAAALTFFHMFPMIGNERHDDTQIELIFVTGVAEDRPSKFGSVAVSTPNDWQSCLISSGLWFPQWWPAKKMMQKKMRFGRKMAI